MIFDKQNLFSEDQAVTVTADSTNVIDLGLTETGEGEEIEINAFVTTAFADGTSLKVSLVTSATSTFASTTTMLDTAVILTAALVAGYRFVLGKLPDDMLRYCKLVYTVVGTMSAGKIFAGLNLDHQSWKALPDAL
jgi:hypothetical protein